MALFNIFTNSKFLPSLLLATIHIYRNMSAIQIAQYLQLLENFVVKCPQITMRSQLFTSYQTLILMFSTSYSDYSVNSSSFRSSHSVNSVDFQPSLSPSIFSTNRTNAVQSALFIGFNIF